MARSLRENINQCILKDRIVNNPPKYTDARLGKPALEYCAWIKDDATWGGETEICILSEHFNVEITVVIISTRPGTAEFFSSIPGRTTMLSWASTRTHVLVIIALATSMKSWGYTAMARATKEVNG